MSLYRDRSDAGQALSEKLSNYANYLDLLILALPRGGVPVAYEIAQELHLPLDVFLVRKLGVPGYKELAMGAIASGGVRVFNDSIIQSLNISNEAIEKVIAKEELELKRREKIYRGDRPFPKLENKSVVLVDDGLATGASMRVAIKALRQHQPAQILVAVPVASASTCADLSHTVDGIICNEQPEPFFSVGYWYDDFSEVKDEEVCSLLKKAQLHHSWEHTKKSFPSKTDEMQT